jgi:hypothetical protein
MVIKPLPHDYIFASIVAWPIDKTMVIKKRFKTQLKCFLFLLNNAQLVCFGLLILVVVLLIWRGKFKWCGLPPICSDCQAGVDENIAF